MTKVLVLLADGLEEMEAVSPVDLLRRAGIEVITASINGKLEVEGAHGITIHADKTLDDAANSGYDMVVLPGGGGGTEKLSQNGKVLELVNDFYKKGKYIAAICAAPIVLAKAGILEGQKVTSYPGTENELGKVDYSLEKVVKSGKIITSRGPGTAIYFALELIKLLKNEEKAEAIRKQIVFNI